MSQDKPSKNDPAEPEASDAKASRRRKRGDYQKPLVIPAIRPDPIERQIPAEDFAALIARVEAFAQRRFGPILPQVGAAFFRGRSADEVRDEGLQAAFRAWVIYGFRDEQGVRIVDMFAAAGIPAQGEIARALTAARQARFAYLEIAERNPRTKQVRAVDLHSDPAGQQLDLLDRRSFDALELGGVLAGWIAPVGKFRRPLGAATLIAPKLAPLLKQGLGELSKSAGPRIHPADFATRASVQFFWLAYRVANLDLESGEA